MQKIRASQKWMKVLRARHYQADEAKPRRDAASRRECVCVCMYKAQEAQFKTSHGRNQGAQCRGDRSRVVSVQTITEGCRCSQPLPCVSVISRKKEANKSEKCQGKLRPLRGYPFQLINNFRVVNRAVRRRMATERARARAPRGTSAPQALGLAPLQVHNTTII